MDELSIGWDRDLIDDNSQKFAVPDKHHMFLSGVHFARVRRICQVFLTFLANLVHLALGVQTHLMGMPARGSLSRSWFSMRLLKEKWGIFEPLIETSKRGGLVFF